MQLNLSELENSVLEALAAEQELNKTQLMRQTLRLYQLVHERMQQGQQLAFVKDGKVVPTVIPSMLPPLK